MAGPSRWKRAKTRFGRGVGVASVAALLVIGVAPAAFSWDADEQGKDSWPTYTTTTAKYTTTMGQETSTSNGDDSTTTTSKGDDSTTTTDKYTTTTVKDTTTTTVKDTTTTTVKDTTTTTVKDTTTTTVPPGGEGCTPGYWKQQHHFDSWVGYSPSDDFETVFGVDASFSATLGAALRQGGGGELALGRHAVAALLNASNPEVDYAYTTAQVIALVQEAYATGDFEGVKDLFEEANEEGCPLN